MSNFGTGQGLFGNNQNKNQGTATPGSTPAGTSAFGGLGSNTASGSAFGGVGAGNTPGGGTASAPTGSIFGTGGSAFGSGGNTNTSTSTPSGTGTGGTGSLFGGSSLFAANPATNTGSTTPATGGGLFANAGSNPGTSGTTTGQQSLFGNTTSAPTGGGTGGSLFGFPKPAVSGASPFASGTGAPTGTSGSGGNLFPGAGNSSATGSTTAAATGTSTGSSTLGGGLFGNNKPADGAAKPATSSFFSAPTTGGTTSTGTTATGNTSSMFSNLAAKPSETSTSLGATPSTQPQAGANAFKPLGTSTLTTPQPNQSGFTLGGSAATGDKAASTTAPAGGGLFGNIGAAANKDGEKRGAAPPTFSLGGQLPGTATAPAAPTTEKKDGAAAPSLFPSLGGATSGIAKPATSLGGSSSTGTTSGTQPLATTTTSAISVAPPSMLKGKSIEEIINRWSTDLEIHVRDFNKFASEVAVWDRSLIENGNNLAALYSHVLAAEREQNDIDQSLDHIEQQEKELTATVEMYEKQMSDILGGQSGTLRTLDTGPADTERDKNYMLATELHNHLDDLSSSLTQLIDSVNSMSIGQNDTKRASADDPMAQIAHVLSNHLESLQWIDGASRELEEKVVEVEKRIKDVGTGSQITPGALSGGSRSRGFGLIR